MSSKFEQIVSAGIANTSDLYTSLTSVRSWVLKRSEKIHEVMELDEYWSSLKASDYILDSKVIELKATRFIDASGKVHGIKEVYDVATSSHRGIVVDDTYNPLIKYDEYEGFWAFYNQAAYDHFQLWLEAADDYIAVQSDFIDYVSLALDSLDEEGQLAQSVITAGFTSTNETVREFANQLALHQGDGVRALISYLSSGIMGLSEISDVDSTDDIGYVFSIEDYQGSPTMNLLEGAWTVIKDVAGVVASIAMIAGKGIVMAVGGVIYGASLLIGKVKEYISAATQLTVGSGVYNAYALAVKRYVPVTGVGNQPTQCAIHLPWGHILIGNIETKDGQRVLPMLIYPACTRTTSTPFGWVRDWNANSSTPSPYVFGRMAAQDDDEAQSMFDNANAACLYDINHYRVPTGYTHFSEQVDLENPSDLVGWTLRNLGCLCYWIAENALPGMSLDELATDYRHITDDDRNGPFTLSDFPDAAARGASIQGYVLASPFTVEDPGLLIRGDYWYEYSAHGVYRSNSARLQLLNDFITDKVVDPEGVYDDMDFWSALEGAYAIITRTSPVQVTAEEIISKFVLRTVRRARAGNRIMIGPLTGSGTEFYYYSDPYAACDDMPKIVPDPLITPPKIDGRSIKIAAALFLVAAAVITTATFITRHAIRKAQKRKCIKREQEAISAQEAYKQDLTNTDKANDYLRAQRRFTRYANRVGYSSNNVGSFAVGSPAERAVLSSALSALTPTQEILASELAPVLSEALENQFEQTGIINQHLVEDTSALSESIDTVSHLIRN